jgi:hypothetical protein
MWLRRANAKLCCDGTRAALLQRHYAVAEGGRVRGASGLAAVVVQRAPARRKRPCRNKKGKREWVTTRKMPTVSVRRLHLDQLLTGFVPFQAHGSRSSRQLTGYPSTMRESTLRK